MLAKGKKEKEDEVVTFAAYKMFCTKTREEKMSSIAKGEESILQLKADIVKFKADAEQLAKEIADTDADLAAWTEEKAKEDAVREKEHKDFMVVDQDYEGAIAQVANAEATIKAQPESIGQAASLVEVRESLRQVSSLDLVPMKARRLLLSFLQSDPEVRGDNFLQSSVVGPKANAFESHTGGVLDMVKSLGEKFEDEKDEAEKGEMEKKNA